MQRPVSISPLARACRRDKRRYRLLVVLGVSLAVLVPLTALAASPQSPAGSQTPAHLPSAKKAPTGSLFDRQVRESKIHTCATVFSALGNGLTASAPYSVRSQMNAAASNNHSIQSLVILNPPSATPAQQPSSQQSQGQPNAGIVFAAPIGKACEGQLVRVTPALMSCPDVAAQLIKAKGQDSPIGGLTTIAMPNGSQVMLIPVEDNICVSVTVLRAATAG